MNQQDITSHPDFSGHEQVEFKSGENLTAFIAVHSTRLGPAVGGCRMFAYPDKYDALTDVLRLSKGMTYKSALARLPLGGGKAVIIGDPRSDKTRKMLLEMGEFIDAFNGRYITAEDSGTCVNDIATMGEATRYVSGVNPDDSFGGDPSPFTAYGVFCGIREAVSFRLGSNLSGIRVAIQGAGNVGFHLAEMLIDAGAWVTAADVNPENVRRVAELGATITSPDQVLSANVDVLAPCALGGAINEQTIGLIRAGIVAGAANNQLRSADMGAELVARGILYAPDYVINAGGIIDVYYQQQGVRSHAELRGYIDSIPETLRSIFTASDARGVATNKIADELAEDIFRDARRVA